MSTTELHITLKEFLKRGETKEFSGKDMIENVGFSGNEKYYWILSGFVKVVSYTGNGNERIHYIYSVDDFFPLGWLFSERPYQDVTFIALGKVTLSVRTSEAFNKFISKERFTFRDVNRMLLNMHDRIYNLNLETAQERVEHSLLTMALRCDNHSNETIVTLPIPVTHQQIADYVRSSRETVGKILSDMEDKGLITISRKKILVDKEKLSKAVSAKLMM